MVFTYAGASMIAVAVSDDGTRHRPRVHTQDGAARPE
jgi:hypothetical protein